MKIITIDKNCNENECDIDNIEILYKKCGFRKDTNFDLVNTWKTRYKKTKYIVKVYARNKGNHNQVNKFEFPPPIDNVLFYGTCAVLLYDSNNNLIDFTLNLWKQIYKKLYGGFEDLKDTEEDDEAEEDELEHISDSKKTKETGYLKDGFVVDDDDNDMSDSKSNTDNEPLLSSINETTNSENSDNIENSDNETDCSDLNDTSELSEEEYLE
jgi:hypothetical protein